MPKNNPQSHINQINNSNTIINPSSNFNSVNNNSPFSYLYNNNTQSLLSDDFNNPNKKHCSYVNQEYTPTEEATILYSDTPQDNNEINNRNIAFIDQSPNALANSPIISPKFIWEQWPKKRKSTTTGNRHFLLKQKETLSTKPTEITSAQNIQPKENLSIQPSKKDISSLLDKVLNNQKKLEENIINITSELREIKEKLDVITEKLPVKRSRKLDYLNNTIMQEKKDQNWLLKKFEESIERVKVLEEEYVRLQPPSQKMPLPEQSSINNINQYPVSKPYNSRFYIPPEKTTPSTTSFLNNNLSQKK